MPIKYLTLNINPRPKPRGALTKSGHINHSEVKDRYGVKYKDWKIKAVREIKKGWKFSATAQLQGLILIHYVPDKRGDIDNYCGSIFDSLKGTVISDDTLTYIPRVYSDHIVVDDIEEFERVEVVLIYNELNYELYFWLEIGKVLLPQFVKSISNQLVSLFNKGAA